jgi:hypothetical protein
MGTSTARNERINAHYDRAVLDLVEAHSKLARSPLVLAVRFDDGKGLDVDLLEVIENFPGKEDDPLFTTELAPNERFLILGKLHLTLASPAQLRRAIDEAGRRRKTASAAIVTAVRRHGRTVFTAASPESRAREARALKQALLAGCGGAVAGPASSTLPARRRQISRATPRG